MVKVCLVLEETTKLSSKLAVPFAFPPAMREFLLLHILASIWSCQYSEFWPSYKCVSSVGSVAQSCPILCDPMNRSTPGLPVHHQLREFTQTHVHWVSDAILVALICISWWHIMEKAMALHSSTLAWKIPWMEEPGKLQSMGSLGVGHDWATSLSLFTFMHWRRKWQPTPVFLPGESQGRQSLVGCRLWGHTESDTTEAT